MVCWQRHFAVNAVMVQVILFGLCLISESKCVYKLCIMHSKFICFGCICLCVPSSLCVYHDLYLTLKYGCLQIYDLLPLFTAVSSELVMPDDLDDGGSMNRFERAAAPDDNCGTVGSGSEPPNNETGPQGNVDSNNDCSPHPNFVSKIT